MMKIDLVSRVYLILAVLLVVVALP